MSRLNINAGLTSIAAMLLATSAFAEPPIQEGDTLESLSQVRIETTVNGQPGSLEQMGIPKEVIAQAIAQNAVIDLQARTLLPQSATLSPAPDRVAQGIDQTQDTIGLQHQTLAQSDVQGSVATDLQAAADAVPVEDQQLTSGTIQAQQIVPEVNSAEQAALQQADQQLDYSHALQAQTAASSAPVVVSDDPAVSAQMSTVQEAEEINAAVEAAVDETDPNAAAIMPSGQDGIDPNAQALPAEADQLNDTQQLGDTEVESTSPLQ